MPRHNKLHQYFGDSPTMGSGSVHPVVARSGCRSLVLIPVIVRSLGARCLGWEPPSGSPSSLTATGFTWGEKFISPRLHLRLLRDEHFFLTVIVFIVRATRPLLAHIVLVAVAV